MILQRCQQNSISSRRLPASLQDQSPSSTVSSTVSSHCIISLYPLYHRTARPHEEVITMFLTAALLERILYRSGPTTPPPPSRLLQLDTFHFLQHHRNLRRSATLPPPFSWPITEHRFVTRAGSEARWLTGGGNAGDTLWNWRLNVFHFAEMKLRGKRKEIWPSCSVGAVFWFCCDGRLQSSKIEMIVIYCAGQKLLE